MKPRVTWILFLVIFIFSSCMSRWAFISETDYTKREEQIVKIYEKLSKKYDRLLEDPIEEEERKALEEKFQTFYVNLNELTVKNDPKHLQFLQEYRNQVRIKLNYLQDLKED